MHLSRGQAMWSADAEGDFLDVAPKMIPKSLWIK